MIPTAFGFLIIAVGLRLMTAPITDMVCFVIIASLLGAASAIDLPALGGSTILPANLALLFLVLRILLAPVGKFSTVALAVRENMFLTFYCLYGGLTAFFLPQFSHSFNMPQLRVLSLDLFATAPVEFTSQNITTAFYLFGTLLASLAAFVSVRFEHQTGKIVRAAIFVAWIHIAFGALDAVLSKFGVRDWLDIFRNANYSQLIQDVDGVQRIAGIFPETSAYAGYGFIFFVLNVELWMRSEKPRITGITSIALLAMLLLTTSATAYVSIAIYGVFLLLRFLLTPMRLSFDKKLYLSSFALAAITIILMVATFMPDMANLILDIGQQMTVGKLHSESGLQRSFWASKGWEAFWNSDWLGIGAGSFRSSGLIPSIAGSLGVLGLLAFSFHVLTVLKPLQVSSHDVNAGHAQRICAAFGWAAVMGLIPPILTAPTPDPGLLFGIFSGVALSRMRLPNRRSTINVSHLEILKPL